MKSSIATWLPAYKRRWRKLKPYGLVVHTSGRGIVNRAIDSCTEPIDLALEWYRSKGSVHYVIGYDGRIYQLLAEDKRGAHVGISMLERHRYLSGNWKHRVPNRAYWLWQDRWAGYQSPQHLYPTKSPNACYLGVEVIPVSRDISEYTDAGLWFTDAQHRAVAELARDISNRHGTHLLHPRVPNPRLLGHEDIDAFARWDTYGGWDPGSLRRAPRFDWGKVRDSL